MPKAKSKISTFSELCDLAIVVKDLDRAVEFYQSLGIGPFEPSTATKVTDRKIYGKPSDAKLKGAGAKLGTVQLLLIQPMQGDSVQKEYLNTKGEGINKLGFKVTDLEKEVTGMERKGFKVISSGRFPNGGGFAYFDTREVGGVILAVEQH